jgi:hypothetical protein
MILSPLIRGSQPSRQDPQTHRVQHQSTSDRDYFLQRQKLVGIANLSKTRIILLNYQGKGLLQAIRLVGSSGGGE